MGATYTRQSTITDGAVIEASHFNDEYNQILAAFAVTTGHTHDGTAAEGGPITKLLGTALTIGDGTAGTDIAVTFDGESADGVLTWMEDEDYFQFSDDLLLSTTEKLQFRDTAIYINSSTDGQLDLVADTEIQIAATTIDINGNVDVSGTLTVTGDLTVSGDDLTMGTNTDTAVMVADGTNFNPVVPSGDVGLTNAGVFSISSNVIVNADINSSAAIADSKLATISTADKVSGAAIQIDGATDGTSITLADADKILVDDGGTTKYITASQLNTYTSGSVSADDISTGDAAVTLATSSGNITIDATANDSDIIFKGTDATADITMLTLDGSEAGAATFNNKVVATELDISGNMDIDGTSNLDAVDIDGAVQIDGTVTVGVDDTGLDVKFFGATAGSYFLWDESADSILLTDSTPLKIGDSQDLTLYHDGTNSYITNSQGALKVATETSGIAVSIGHTTSETTINDNLTVTGTLTGTLATAAQSSITSLGTLTTLTVDNVIINGSTIGHTGDTDLITVASGIATVAGEVSMTTLDIGGTNVTSTAAELNLIDGGTARGTDALADGDGILINDGGTMKMTNVTAVKTYMAGSAASAGFAVAMAIAL